MSIKNLLHQKKPVGCFWLSLGSIPLVEFALEAQLEAIVFDLQHGLWDRRLLEQAAGISKGKTMALARVSDCSRFAISMALDSGVEGVIIPLVETAEQAAQALDWSQYPPRGSRSAGGLRPLADFKTYQRQCADNIMVAVMVETRRGLENIDDIVAVSGLDMIFIGSGDLSLSLGLEPSDPKLEEAIIRIKQACDRAAVPCGIFTADIQAAKRRRDDGYLMVVVGDDITLSRKMIQNCRAEYER